MNTHAQGPSKSEQWVIRPSGQNEVFCSLFALFGLLVKFLRVVQTESILFLKSMSERVGSDIERLSNSMMNFLIDYKSIADDSIQSRSLSDPSRSDIDFKNKMDWACTTLNRCLWYSVNRKR